jgi:hypothetical protein
LGITPLIQLKADVKMGYEEFKQSKAWEIAWLTSFPNISCLHQLGI